MLLNFQFLSWSHNYILYFDFSYKVRNLMILFVIKKQIDDSSPEHIDYPIVSMHFKEIKNINRQKKKK